LFLTSAFFFFKTIHEFISFFFSSLPSSLFLCFFFFFWNTQRNFKIEFPSPKEEHFESENQNQNQITEFQLDSKIFNFLKCKDQPIDDDTPLSVELLYGTGYNTISMDCKSPSKKILKTITLPKSPKSPIVCFSLFLLFKSFFLVFFILNFYF